MFKMTPNIWRNIVGPKATRRYPQEKREPFENARGRIVADPLTCTCCGVCAAKCPSRCIAVDKKASTWSYDPYACVYCGVCVESCPSSSVRQHTEYRSVTGVKELVVVKGEGRKKKVEGELAVDMGARRE